VFCISIESEDVSSVGYGVRTHIMVAMLVGAKSITGHYIGNGSPFHNLKDRRRNLRLNSYFRIVLGESRVESNSRLFWPDSASFELNSSLVGHVYCKIEAIRSLII
jgi:hypothetical protein